MRIVILDGYSVNPGDLSWDALREMGDVEVYDRTSPEEVVTRAEKAEIVLTNKVVLDKPALDRLPSLRYIGVLATGYNVVNLEETRQRGIIVTNIPAYSTDSVAQMTFAHILNITNADFCYWDSPLHELAGKTLGIVGLGNIGKRVARIAADFGMDVFALTSKEPSALPHGVQKTTMEGLLAVSDILTLHCPLTESTRHLIRAETIQKMKHGAIIINTGRGPLVDEHDVAKALRRARHGTTGMRQRTALRPQRLHHPAHRLGHGRGTEATDSHRHRECAGVSLRNTPKHCVKKARVQEWLCAQ